MKKNYTYSLKITKDTTLFCQVIFSDRKSVSIKIKEDASICVRAPYYAPRFQVEAFIESKKDWIYENHQKMVARKEASVIERVVDFEKGEHAVTHFHKIAENKDRNLSLLLLHLETGRTHQIRVHMKHIGAPLIGDYLYNPDMTYINRQALPSYRLTFNHPITKEPMQFTAPVPDDMQNAFAHIIPEII